VALTFTVRAGVVDLFFFYTFISMKNKNLFNRKGLKSYRSSLRNRSTSAEAVLWDILKSKNPDGDPSTTLAATSLCNTLIIIVLRPPLLQKEGKVI
jgi:hypothetical protein